MKYLLALSLFLTVLFTAAQMNTVPAFYKKAIAFSPLAMADVDHTILLSGEYRWSEKQAVTADAGFIFASDYLSDIRRVTGFSFRPAYRLYYGKKKKSYWQNQVFYKHVTYQLHDWLGKECVNDVPAYDQLQNFKFRKQVLGVNTIMGAVLPLFSEHWFFDLYAGIGVRAKYHHVVKEPRSCYLNNNGGWFDLYRPKMVVLNIPMGIKMGYRFN